MFSVTLTACSAAEADDAVLAPDSTAVSSAESIVCAAAELLSADADGAAAPFWVMSV